MWRNSRRRGELVGLWEEGQARSLGRARATTVNKVVVRKVDSIFWPLF